MQPLIILGVADHGDIVQSLRSAMKIANWCELFQKIVVKWWKLTAESIEKSLLNTNVIGVTIYCLDGTICLWTVSRDVQRFVLPIRDVRAGTSSRENSWKYPSFLLHALLVTVNQVSTSYSSSRLIFPAKLDEAMFILSLFQLRFQHPLQIYYLSFLMPYWGLLTPQKNVWVTFEKTLMEFFLLQKHSFV